MKRAERGRRSRAISRAEASTDSAISTRPTLAALAAAGGKVEPLQPGLHKQRTRAVPIAEVIAAARVHHFAAVGARNSAMRMTIVPNIALVRDR